MTGSRKVLLLSLVVLTFAATPLASHLRKKISDNSYVEAASDELKPLKNDGDRGICAGATIAKAGPDQILSGLLKVQLDGSASRDLADLGLTYRWRIDSLPSRSKLIDAQIMDAQSDKPSFTPDFPGVYALELIVSNGCSWDSDTVMIIAHCNAPPSIEDDVKLSYEWGDVAELDGSQSVDVDQDELTYSWTFESVPKTSRLTDQDIMDRDQPTAHLIADTPGLFKLCLTVFDGCSFAKGYFVITFRCSYPRAHAGSPERLVWDLSKSAPRVILNATKSHESGGVLADFAWSLVHWPMGSKLQNKDIQERFSEEAWFIPDKVGTYGIKLVVTNECGQEQSDFVYKTIVSSNEDEHACDGPPQARAGNLHQVTWSQRGTTTHLLATQSFDPNGRDLTFMWSLIERPEGSGLSSSSISKPLNSVASFLPDGDGEYVFQVTVSNGCESATNTTTVVVLCNEAPTAYIQDLREIEWLGTVGDDIAVAELQAVADDREGDMLVYKWEFLNKPEHSSLTEADFSSIDTPRTTFAADAAGEYHIQVTVSDGCSEAKDRTLVTFVCDTFPEVKAGEDQVVEWTQTHEFDWRLENPEHYTLVAVVGEATSQLIGDKFTFFWSFKSTPPGSNLNDTSIFHREESVAHFRADVGGNFVLQMSVTNGCGNVAIDTVFIEITNYVAPPEDSTDEGPEACNDKPKADAGPDIFLYEDAAFARLDAAGSSDEDGDDLRFRWRFVSTPEGSRLVQGNIAHHDEMVARFEPDVPGDYIVRLTVWDHCNSDEDQIRITYVVEDEPW